MKELHGGTVAASVKTLFCLLFAVRISQPVRNVTSNTTEKERGLLRRVITDWKTPVSI